MATPATNRDAITIGVIGAFVAIGSFLPWARVGIFSLAGTDGDGVFTLIIGVVIAVIAFVSKDRPSRPARIGVLLLFGFAFFIAWGVFGNFSGDMDTVGAGLMLVLLASFVGFLMGIAWLTRTVAPPAPIEPPSPGRHSESP